MDNEIRSVTADLHVHTVLSPCAAVEMIPPLVVEQAIQKGIGLVAITDHNASANVRAVQRAAAGSLLAVLPGMELQTREEVHLLCIFDQLGQLEEWQAFVDDRLPDLQNRPEFFGEQYIVDETGEFIEHENRLLAASVDLGFDRAVEEVHRLGGLAIPAHVDRPVNSLFANLGFVPPNVKVDALEISRWFKPDQARLRYPQLAFFPLIAGGDVHHLDQFLGATLLGIAEPTVAEIRLALAGQGGRYVKLVRSPS